MSDPENQSSEMPPLLTSSILGVVKDDLKRPVVGITVSLAPPKANRHETDESGQFKFFKVPADTYRLCFLAAHYEIKDINVEVAPGETKWVEVKATLARYNLSGTIVNEDGNGVGEVSVEVVGEETIVTKTNRYGDYVAPGLNALQPYTLRPKKPGYDFIPGELTVSQLLRNVDRENFVATCKFYQISGTIRDTDGIAVSDVTITLEGQTTQSKQSDKTGAYSFLPVRGGKTYVLKPAKVGYTFSPPIVPIAYLASDVVQDFYGSPDPAVATEKAPNQWNALIDYSKTIITLASAFLAVTVTFSGQLIGKGSSKVIGLFLSITWGLLVAAIASGLVTTAFVINYLRVRKNEKVTIFCANVSYSLLLLAGISFLLVGWFSINTDDSPNVGSVIETTLKRMPEMVKGAPNSKWSLESLQTEKSVDNYKLLVNEDVTSRKFYVWVDPIKQRVIRIEPVSATPVPSPSPAGTTH